jgi:hypothetical protein
MMVLVFLAYLMKISAQNAFLEQPSSGTLKSKGWKDKYLLKVMRASKLKDLNMIVKIG